MATTAVTQPRRRRARTSDDEADTLTPKEAAKECKVSVGTLKRWRALRCGPPFVKPNRGKVFYSRAAIAKWKADRASADPDDAKPYVPAGRR